MQVHMLLLNILKIMKVKCRIIETNEGKFKPEYFKGFWIFGSWKSFGISYKKIKNAEQYIYHIFHKQHSGNNKVIREITIKLT